MMMTYRKMFLTGAAAVVLLTGCSGNQTARQEDIGATGNTVIAAENAATETTEKAVVSGGYVLKDDTDASDHTEEDKSIIDTSMSASDKTKLDSLIDEIGKELDEEND